MKMIVWDLPWSALKMLSFSGKRNFFLWYNLKHEEITSLMKFAYAQNH